ncbi:MAG: tRNA(Ile)-lysidine synthase [Thermomicrobiales bacterium]|nr:tRNA(Ile)-lysidine synthase [Thermomicrobiales bacterium]
MEQRVLARLKELRLPEAGRIVVGFSGGSDSLALAAVLARLAPVAAVQVSLFHVDHGLRPESSEDAAQCGRLATQLGLQFTAVRLPPDLQRRHPGVGLEEAARRERYVALAREADRAGAALVAVAHHREDQAETVLLHLLRGAGLKGASGMAELTRLAVPWWEITSDAMVFETNLWRPLLEEPRAIVRGYALETGLTPVEDASNAETRFRRNRLRHEVLPLLQTIIPGADAALARYARIAREEDVLLNDLAERTLRGVVRDEGTLDGRALSDEALPIQRRVVQLWLEGIAPGMEFALDRVDAILAAAHNRQGDRRIEVGENLTVYVTGDRLSARIERIAAGNADEEET